MTYGIFTQGDSSQLILSTESNSLSFSGKATFVSRQGLTGAGYGPLYYNRSGNILYNWPQTSVYNFTFDSGGKECIFFVSNDYPYKNAVAAASLSGNIYSISIVSQPAGTTAYVPTVYCFHKSTSAGNVGYGMTLYRATGETAFTTNDKPLVINKIYTPSTQDSNLTNYSYSGYLYVGNSGNPGSKTISYANPIADSGNPVKPIVYTPSYQTATRYYGSAFATYFYELIAAYNYSTNQMEYEWCCFTFSGGNLGTYPTSARTGFTMISDGSLYD